MLGPHASLGPGVRGGGRTVPAYAVLPPPKPAAAPRTARGASAARLAVVAARRCRRGRAARGEARRATSPLRGRDSTSVPRPPSRIGGYSHDNVRIRTVWHPSAMALRPARPADAPAITRIFQAARAHSLAYLPILHTDAEDHAFFARSVERGGVTVAESGGAVVAFLALDGEEIDHLYVDPRRPPTRPQGAALLGATRRPPASISSCGSSSAT